MEIDPKMIGIAVCCREWYVLLGVGMGYCGICKTQPVVIWTQR